MIERKAVTLGDGTKVLIRKLCVKDFIQLGSVPDVLADGKTPSSDAHAKEYGIKLTEIILVNCTGKIGRPGQIPQRIVSKRFDECGPLEICVDEFIGTEDATKITQEVMELSGATQAAKEAASPFHQEQVAVGHAPQSGEALPSPANGAA